RGARAAHALRHRHEYRPYARRGRSAVLGDARAHPPDRGQGAAQAQAPLAEPEAAELLGQLTQRVGTSRWAKAQGMVWCPALLGMLPPTLHRAAIGAGCVRQICVEGRGDEPHERAACFGYADLRAIEVNEAFGGELLKARPRRPKDL